MRKLLGEDPGLFGLWLRFDRAQLRAAIDRDTRRDFDTPLRPRDIAGGIAVTCEYAEGRPCIGTGSFAELDASGGYGSVLSATVGIRAQAGDHGYSADLAIDRAYAIAEFSPLTVEIGRDVLVLGPRSHTQLGWGMNAPPLDHIRISTSEPIVIADWLRANALYAVGQLREPQRYPGSLVTMSRVQLDLFQHIELGTMQLLELGGDGAPSFGIWDFVLEHVRRGNLSATEADTSNRRFGGDISFDIPALWGARLYYQLVFEDIRRKRWMDAIRYDADHLFGLELAAIGRHRIALVVEYHQTGVRSQEHNPRVTGFTNAGRVVGSPLGPDAAALYLAVRIPLSRATLVPWAEYASLSSDTYTFVEDGPISPARSGPSETRERIGTRVQLLVGPGISFETEAVLERINGFAFAPAEARNHVRIAADLVWRAR